MALNGFVIDVKKDIAEVLTNSGRIVRVPADRAKGLPPLTTSRVRAEAKPRKGTTRQLLAFDYLVHVKGWKPHQAAAIVGRLSQESGKNLDPTAVGDKGTAFGIAQWRGIRNTRRLKFHRENGNDPKDLFADLDFFDFELRNYEKRAFEQISAARDIPEAARGMMMFERPRDFTWENPEAGHGWDNTLSFSTDVMEDAGLEPSASFNVVEGLPEMKLPDFGEELVEDKPTRLGDIMNFGGLDQDETSPVMDDVWTNVGEQQQSIQDMIGSGVEAQMNWFKPA